MGDKSPKSKDKDKKQGAKRKADDQARRDKKQDRTPPVVTSKKK